jgi:hypothetical protein
MKKRNGIFALVMDFRGPIKNLTDYDKQWIFKDVDLNNYKEHRYEECWNDWVREKYMDFAKKHGWDVIEVEKWYD